MPTATYFGKTREEWAAYRDSLPNDQRPLFTLFLNWFANKYPRCVAEVDERNENEVSPEHP